MYDELEHAAGAAPRAGRSVLAWLAIAGVSLLFLGVAGSMLAYRAVRSEIREMTEAFRVDAVRPAPVVARAVARTLSEMGIDDRQAGVDVAAVVARALQSDGLGGRSRASDPMGDEGRAGQADGGDVDGFLRIRTPEGDLTADLRAGDQGGSFVVRGPDGEVVIDLTADATGGRLVVRADGEVARFGAGREATPPPEWLGALAEDVPDLHPVVSGKVGDVAFGALTWTIDRSPAEVVDAYRERLIEEGYQISVEHALTGLDEPSASVMGRQDDPDRTVLFAATLDGRVTRVALGYGSRGDGAGR